MKRLKQRSALLLTTVLLTAYQTMTVLAVTEEEVAAYGKETGAGNVFIWFLCAIAFLKVSQKIDSFMSSLGINVGHTGGSMLGDLMIAAKTLTTAKNFSTGGSFHGGNSRGSFTMNPSSFLAGGLAGAVHRQFSQGAVNSVTGQAGNPISRKAFESSLKKGGTFANQVTGAVAQGSLSYTGSMTGPQAAQALTSYMGQMGISDAPAYSNVEIGGGRITGTETSIAHPNGTAFAMYHTDQYMPPDGSYDTITAADNTTWYRQYAADTVERTPYMTDKGEIAYHENLVKTLPPVPKRKDRI